MNGFIGRFKILREIGLGGVGRVYCAKDPLLKRNVALKVLLAGEFADERELGRFQREMENCAKLRHPNIVPLYEVGREPGKGIYMVMEFVEGISLEDFIHQHKIYPHQAAQITCILAKAVHYAHSQEIIHRDLKPQNILMRDNKIPMITDFGLARKMDPEAKDRLTKTGDFVGTPGHMPPEQIEGQEPIPQMDVYALGCVFYEMLTGSPPYQGEAVEMLYNILDETEISPSPRQKKTEIAKDLDIICQKAMHKDYRKRYEAAAELAQDIELYLQGKPIHARPIGIFERAYQWTRRNFATTLTIILCALGLAIALAVTYFNQQRNIALETRKYLKQGNIHYQLALKKTFAGKSDWQPDIRLARSQYEKALALDFQNGKVRQALYELELLYGWQSLKEGFIERAEDAVSAAEFSGIEDAELKKLQQALEQEKKNLEMLYLLKQKDTAKNIDDVVDVLNRYPQNTLRYIIRNSTDPETNKLARQIFREQVPHLVNGSESIAKLLSIAYLSREEATALGIILQDAYPEAAKNLLPKLRGTDIRSMVNTLIVIREVKNQEAVAPLVKMLKEDTNPYWQTPAVQIGICQALGELNAKEAVVSLEKLLAKTTNSRVAIAASRALGKFGPRAKSAIPALIDKHRLSSNSTLVLESWKALMEIAPSQGISQAAATLKNPGTAQKVYTQIWFFLAAHPEKQFFIDFVEALPPAAHLQNTGLQFFRLSTRDTSLLVNRIYDRLNDLLKSSATENTQKKAVKMFMELECEKKSLLLKQALSSPYRSVRREAAFSLCLLAPNRCNEFSKILHWALPREKDKYVKFYLSWAAAKIESPKLEKQAQKMMKSRDLLAKLSAILIMKKNYVKTEELLEALNSE